MRRIACLDAELSERNRPKVTVRRHPVDWSKVPEAIRERVTTILADEPHQYVYYLNPTCTVACPEPTPEFFGEVRQRQAEWCRRASQTIPRRVRRRVSQWVGDDGPFRSKGERYFHRALCYTGVLFVNGKFIHPSEWKRIEGRGVLP
jgi:hypothetical protein